jgi:hypothetical protein
MIKSRSVYQSYLGSHMIENTQGQEGWVALEQLDLFLPILRELFAKHQGLKIHLSATTMFYMSIGGDDEFAPMKIDGHKDQYHTTHIERITDPTQIRSTLKGLGERLQEIVASAELQGSGWVFDNIKNLELHVARYHPVGGAAMSWTLSPQLKHKGALINVQIRDDGWKPQKDDLQLRDHDGDRPARLDWCFKYAVLSALFPAKKDKHLSAKYENYLPEPTPRCNWENWGERSPDWGELQFPLVLDDVIKFEELNADFISTDEEGQQYHASQARSVSFYTEALI